ncbi:hypothetical protein ACF0H5_016489 [Mactra antiquata]
MRLTTCVMICILPAVFSASIEIHERFILPNLSDFLIGLGEILSGCCFLRAMNGETTFDMPICITTCSSILNSKGANQTADFMCNHLCEQAKLAKLHT